MLTKISQSLTVLVTVLSLAFMGGAMASSIARTNWKEKVANEFPRAKIQELQTQIDAYTKERDNYAALVQPTLAAIEADQKAMVAKAGMLNEYARKLETDDVAAREANAASAVTAQQKLDTDKARREEVQRLFAQYEELLSQRQEAESEVRRLRDLLYQSRGVLQRAEGRNLALKEALGQPVTQPYDAAQDELELPKALKPSRLGPPLKKAPTASSGGDESAPATGDETSPKEAAEEGAEMEAGDEPEMLDDPDSEASDETPAAEESDSDASGEDAEEPEMRDEPDAEAGDSNDPPANDEETDAAGAAEAEAEPRQAA
ncbi:MAG: hypothetical protein ACKOFW_19020 [Planctomycetaceae bacterium]